MVNLPVAERANMVVGVGQGISERENKTIKRLFLRFGLTG